MKAGLITFIGFLTLLITSSCVQEVNSIGKKYSILNDDNNSYIFKHVNLYYETDTIDILLIKKNKIHFICIEHGYFIVKNSDLIKLYTFGIGLKKDTLVSRAHFPIRYNQDSTYNDIFYRSALSFWQDINIKLTEDELIIRSDKPRTWGLFTQPKAMEWIISRVPMEKKI